MRPFSKPITWVSLALALGVLAAPAAFAVLAETSTLHVTAPIDVGGTILEAGDYVISVVPNDANRNILRVTNPDGTKVFATVLSTPHALGSDENAEDTSFVYYRPTEGNPLALRTWFASDSTSGGGHDIVYPQARAMELAAAAGEPVYAYSEPATPDDLATAEIVVVTPDKQTVPYTFTAEPEAPVRIASSTAPEMPRTASSLPLFGTLGLLLLAAAIVVHAYRVS